MKKLRQIRCAEDGTLVKWDDKKRVYRCKYGHIFAVADDEEYFEGDIELNDEVIG